MLVRPIQVDLTTLGQVTDPRSQALEMTYPLQNNESVSQSINDK